MYFTTHPVALAVHLVLVIPGIPGILLPHRLLALLGLLWAPGYREIPWIRGNPFGLWHLLAQLGRDFPSLPGLQGIPDYQGHPGGPGVHCSQGIQDFQANLCLLAGLGFQLALLPQDCPSHQGCQGNRADPQVPWVPLHLGFLALPVILKKFTFSVYKNTICKSWFNFFFLN